MKNIKKWFDRFLALSVLFDFYWSFLRYYQVVVRCTCLKAQAVSAKSLPVTVLYG